MKKKQREPNSSSPRYPGNVSKAAGQRLTTFNVGALPILERIIRRAKLEDFLRDFVVEDKRCTLSPVSGILLLVKNYLVSRLPIYGVGDWASHHLPELLGLKDTGVNSLNDDRVGRCLDRLFDADCPALILAITRHVVDEFHLDLSEIHNDSTTITFSGDYDGASEGMARGKTIMGITFGHNKDHRPDLKQLLYNLTVTSDGTVPVAFGIESGNVTDDQTHCGTWDLLCQIVGGPNFIYVADSKLATHANMSHIANRGGRFVSVLPRTRRETKFFRQQLSEDRVGWEEIKRVIDDDGLVTDAISIAKEQAATAEGYRLLWFHSTRKVELDRKARAKAITRAFTSLGQLQLKLNSPRTRYRDKAKVEAAVAKRLSECGASQWMRVEIDAKTEDSFVQETPGRPGPNTRYRKEEKARFELVYDTNYEAVEEAERSDGVFPLVTNEHELSAKEILEVYKRQAQIEKRFSQLKTQFCIAPVFLKRPHRVMSLLTVYYLALLVQALLERELRRAMRDEGIESLPLYYEDRECRAPTTRRVIDLFQNIQRHVLEVPGNEPVQMSTELSDIQREVLRLLRVPEGDYSA